MWWCFPSITTAIFPITSRLITPSLALLIIFVFLFSSFHPLLFIVLFLLSIASFASKTQSCFARQRRQRPLTAASQTGPAFVIQYLRFPAQSASRYASLLASDSRFLAHAPSDERPILPYRLQLLRTVQHSTYSRQSSPSGINDNCLASPRCLPVGVYASKCQSLESSATAIHHPLFPASSTLCPLHPSCLHTDTFLVPPTNFCLDVLQFFQSWLCSPYKLAQANSAVPPKSTHFATHLLLIS